jgi:site-specific DNA recombinase
LKINDVLLFTYQGENAMRAVIYCRVSTDDQEKEGTSLKTQKEACLEYCKSKHYDVLKQFSETYSGLTLDRPKLKELRDLLYSNDIDVIVIYCLDRLSRDPTHGVILTQEIEKYQAKLEAVTENLDSTELGKLINYIKNFASKLEAEKIRERTARGKQARIKEGRLPQGTGIGIYGYSWDKTNGKRLINEREAEIVRQIFINIIKGKSIKKTAVDLNNSFIPTKSGSLWQPPQIKRIIYNPAYIGITYFGKSKRISKTKVINRPKNEWTIIPGITPPIIPEKMFNAAHEALLEAKEKRPIRPFASYPLTSFAFCPKCGSRLGGTTLNGKYRYYQCRGAKPTITRGKFCDSGYINAEKLETEIWNGLVGMITDEDILAISTYTNPDKQKNNLLEILDNDIKKLRVKLKAYPKRESNLIELLSQDAITKSILLEKINNLKNEQIQDEKLLKDLLSSKTDATNSVKQQIVLGELSKQIQKALNKPQKIKTIEAKRKLFELLNLQVKANKESWSFSIELHAEKIYLYSHDIYDLDKTMTEEEKIQTYEEQLSLYRENIKRHPEYNDNLIEQAVKNSGFNLVTNKQTSG